MPIRSSWRVVLALSLLVCWACSSEPSEQTDTAQGPDTVGTDTVTIDTHVEDSGTDTESDAVDSTVVDTGEPPPQPYLDADAQRGGQIYDNWWVTLDLPAPEGTHDLYPTMWGEKWGEVTWTCNECHGWDYKGRDGAYERGEHFTGIRGIFATERSPQEIFDLLASDDTDSDGHALAHLGDDALWDVTRFVLDGVIDGDAIVDPVTHDPDGSAPSGQQLFESAGGCADCHGDDGLKIDFASSAYDVSFIPDVAQTDPYRLVHKVRYGEPGHDPSTNTTWSQTQDIKDLVAYAQSLYVTAFYDADLVRGGMLYNNWWDTAYLREPATTHPLYPTDVGLRTGAQTWRCVQCHGWDYMGVDGYFGVPGSQSYTGIGGIKDVEMSPQELYTFLAETGGNNHGYKDAITGVDIWALVKFVKAGVVDVEDFINTSTWEVYGDATRGEQLYMSSNNCVKCHGPDGAKRNLHNDYGVQFLPDIARDQPLQVLHTVRYGAPGARLPTMPNASEFGFSDTEIADVIAFIQTVQSPPADSAGISRGGQLYDTWWLVDTRYTVPATTHPLYATGTGSVTGADTWRCVECHAWDYKGADGQYASGEHATGFPGLLDTFMPVSEIYALLTDPAGHRYDFLTPDDVWSLAFMVRFGPKDTETWIDPSGFFWGNPTRGETLFAQTGWCIDCHGSDGRSINFAQDPDVRYLGTVANENPWEFLHKVRYAHPGSEMPNSEMGSRSDADNADVGAYVTTLPQQ